MLDYTLEVYVKDGRTKTGERLLTTVDYTGVSGTYMMEELHSLRRSSYPTAKYRLEFHETYVVRKNMMTGAEYKERYDTPISCSPASETFWSM